MLLSSTNKKDVRVSFFAFSTVSKNRHKNANVSTLIQHLGLELVPGKNSQFRNVHIGRSHQCLSFYLESLVALVSEALHRIPDQPEIIFRFPGLYSSNHQTGELHFNSNRNLIPEKSKQTIKDLEMRYLIKPRLIQLSLTCLRMT